MTANSAHKGDSFEKVRNVLQDLSLSKKIKYSDVAAVADDIEELCRRQKKLQALGGDFAHIEVSPYLARAARVVKAKKIVEQLVEDGE